MKKRVLATILAVCLLFSVMACVASAASDIVVGDIISSKRICPGDIINFAFIERPEIECQEIKSEGWEIQRADGIWVPYNGKSIAEDAGTFNLRYFVADTYGNYGYSNVCVVIAKHNPSGAYQTSGTDHWRVCSDCGAEAEKGGHDHLSDATPENKVCSVCGHVRTSQYTGLITFWNWLINLIFSFIG